MYYGILTSVTDNKYLVMLSNLRIITNSYAVDMQYIMQDAVDSNYVD